MKIEKISENQIRCTLSREDLASRQLKISELAYGTEKAKALFRDMMQQASFEFGFEAGDIPIMVEAIPTSPETLVLIITKIEDPDELDTRFSSFSTDVESKSDDEPESFANTLFDHVSKQLEAQIADEDDSDEPLTIPDTDFEDHSDNKAAVKATEKDTSVASGDKKMNITKIFGFSSLDETICFAKNIASVYHGSNTLYKDTDFSEYLLVMKSNTHTNEEFNMICNIASEYGSSINTTYATPTHYKEHLDVIISDNALDVLANL